MSKMQGNIIIFLLLMLNVIIILFTIKPTWDYKLVSFEDSLFEMSINEVGAQGWELVSARRAVTGEGETSRGIYECIFKLKK